MKKEKLFFCFILFICFFSFIKKCKGKEIDIENISFSSFINDCNYQIKQFESQPVFHRISGELLYQGFDDYQISIMDYSGAPDPNEYNHFKLPILYHCKVYTVFYGYYKFACLSIDKNNNLIVVNPEMWKDSYYLIQNTSNSINKTNLENSFTATDINKNLNIYYYYLLDVKGQVNVGMNKFECIERYDIGYECNKFSINLIRLNQIKVPILNYTDIIGILGYNDSILICGNHPSNNSLIVYKYNITTEEQQFLFSNDMKLTHVIQHQFLSTQNCLFFSNKSNSSILYDIFNERIILKNDKLNLNISEHLEQGNERTIYYFMHDAEIEKYIPPINRPGYYGQPLPTEEPYYYSTLTNNSNSIYQLSPVLILLISIFISILFF
ncbi:hypothetical protein DICPUDRAFT_82833 [Dictyostelium purpureum]|uniref:Uncharacterized protein n=1 Tax=Dictyostelium purpureum TaxID=5786 RepID=F0ZXR7_DICPU|nr:uncharacterized protein DICPUDRAFT_82833 [Dictyostelium purpureum]EGC31260.1 hypothetical protein DICPUDRAFT_82833 [Dictyostelium purpureum]|eukprot:XP_003292205.1 hypothetical protein DICPUDRAFT_82833 [Dictyostelium purpureum]